MVNQSVSWTEWDAELVGLELLELKGLDFDLDLTGFNSDDLDRYLAGINTVPGLTDEDDATQLPETAASRLGDLWILGASAYSAETQLRRRTSSGSGRVKKLT